MSPVRFSGKTQTFPVSLAEEREGCTYKLFIIISNFEPLTAMNKLPVIRSNHIKPLLH